MNAPGILPARLRVALLRRVLPSHFTRLATCSLREALDSGGQAALLPSPPGSALGTAAHKLLERAGRGELAGWTKEAIYDEWDRIITAIEERMSTSWLDRHLVPFRQTYRYYAVRRIQACERAATLADSIPKVKGHSTGGRPHRECESWVETPDGLVGGLVDSIERTPDGLVVRDYKSGSIEEPADVGEIPRVKQSYRAQMMLYAAIIAGREGYWPLRAEIESLDGSAVVVIPIEPSECSDLLAKATSLLSSTNSKVEAALDDPVYNLRPLATPGPESCQFCEFRPACVAYWEAREGNSGDWPHDVRGIVKKKMLLGLGTMLLDVQSTPGAELVRVRGLDPARHPALGDTGEGDRVVICNLRPEGAAGAFTQTQLTAVYREGDEQSATHGLQVNTGR